MAEINAIVAEPNPVVQPQGQLISIKLTESNYFVWRQHVFAAVRGYGLDGFLTGKRVVPEEYVTNEDGEQSYNPLYSSWMRQDQLLASWLSSSLSENILISTVGLNSSKEIWESLEINFASQSRAKIMQYRLQLQTLKKGNLPMREYLNKVKVCYDTLAAAGQKVSDDDQVLHILSGLGNDYDSLMVSITSRVEPCSLREVYAILLSFEARLENAEHTQVNMGGSIISANFAASQSGSKRSFGGPSTRGRLPFNRGGRTRTRGGYFRGRGGRSNLRPRCQVCFFTGHTVDRCYHRFDANFTPNNTGTNNQSSQGYARGPVAHISHVHNPATRPTSSSSAAPSEASQESYWFPDSGASNHITYDLNNLNIGSEYQGREQVHIGPSHQAGST